MDEGGRSSAARLVVRPGDRVRADGRLVRFDDADWLDFRLVDGLVAHGGPVRKPDPAVRLVGVDADSVRAYGTGGDTSVIPRHVRVVGVWRDEVITVEEQSPVPRADRAHRFEGVPVGEWDPSDQSMEVNGLQQLRTDGAILRDGWAQTENGALVLLIAAADADEVRRVLAEQLPGRLFVAHSRYTAAQLDEVKAMFEAHANEWGFQIWSWEGMDENCQPYAEAWLTRVSPELAAWADTLHDGLLTLRPSMVPA